MNKSILPSDSKVYLLMLDQKEQDIVLLLLSTFKIYIYIDFI